ncbi:MAG: DegT/DnrJ/EryC1/StrS family aminotransferase [Limisphaera sp.]
MRVLKAGELALWGGEPVRRRPWPEWPERGPEGERRWMRLVREGRWIRTRGPEVELFERRFAGSHGCRHGIGWISGMAAWRAALRTAGLEPGAEVVLPAYGPVELLAGVVELNLVPVFADVELGTGVVTLERVEGVVSPRTRAVLVAHLGGLPVDMAPFRERAGASGWLLIESAGQAVGAVYQDRPCGSWGDLAVFDFGSHAPLSAGSGGIVLTNQEALAARGRDLQRAVLPSTSGNAGGDLPAGNEAMTEWQAALLNAQLDRLEARVKRRDARSRHLAERLAQIPGVHPQERTPGCSRLGCGAFGIRVDAEEFGVPRDAVVAALTAEGIPCSVGAPAALPQLPAIRNRNFGPFLPGALREAVRTRPAPNAQKWGRQAIWLEHWLLLGDQRDMDDIVRAFEKIHAQRQRLRQWARERADSGRQPPP